jgi:hypothetical protein
MVIVDRLHDERPSGRGSTSEQVLISIADASEDQGVARLDEGDGIEGRVARHPHHTISDFQRHLQLWDNTTGAVHTAAK